MSCGIGYFNGCGGGCGGGCNGAAYNRFNDATLLKRELRLVETYANCRNYDCGQCYNNNYYNNYGCGPGSCAPCNPCGFAPPCGVNPPCLEWPYVKEKVKKVKEEKEDDDLPCNPSCKPCHKPKCNNPCEKVCHCNNCIRSYKKIYKA